MLAKLRNSCNPKTEKESWKMKPINCRTEYNITRVDFAFPAAFTGIICPARGRPVQCQSFQARKINSKVEHVCFCVDGEDYHAVPSTIM